MSTNHTPEQLKMKRNVEYEQRDVVTLETSPCLLWLVRQVPQQPPRALSSIGFTHINRCLENFYLSAWYQVVHHSGGENSITLP